MKIILLVNILGQSEILPFGQLNCNWARGW